MTRRTPWSPIFDVERSTGDVVVGATPGTPPVRTVALVTSIAGSVSSPQDVALVGDHIFMPGNVTSSVVAFDVSDPTSPSVTSTLTPLTGGAFNSINAQWCDTDGSTYLYVGSTWQLRVIDISDPSSMSVVGMTASESTNLAVSSGLIYDSGYCYCTVVSGDRLTVVDVSTPASPAVAGTVSDGTNLNAPRGLIKDGDYVYVGGSDGIGVVDVSTPASPSVVDFLSMSGNGPYGLHVAGSNLFVPRTDPNDVVSIDISTPTAIATDDSIDLIFDSFVSLVSILTDRVVAMGNASGHVALVDISDPTSLSQESETESLLDEPRGAVSSGSYIFLAEQTYNGLRVLGVT